MTDTSKKVALPAYLPRRLDAFRIVRGDQTSYILRDKLMAKSHDLDAWQFFLLEVLPGCETAEKLQGVFEDRFGRSISQPEIMGFFGWLADQKLLGPEAEAHPLLKPFTRQGYAVEQGLVKPKSFEELAQLMAPAAAGAGAPAQAAAAPGAEAPAVEEELPPGVADADNLDPKRTRRVLELIPLEPFLKVLLPVLAPLKWGIYVLPLLVLAAVLLLVDHWDVVRADLDQLSATTTLLTHVVFSLFTVNLAAVLTLATVAYQYRATVGSLGIGVFMGFLPRFVVRIRDVRKLSRRQRIWLHGAPLLMRVLLFSLGVLLWFNVRDAYPDLARAGLALSFIAAINVLVASGNPLVRGNAYHLLAAVIDERRLRGKSFRALMEKLRGGGLRESDSNLLAGYGLASLLYAYVLAIIATLLVLHFLLRTTELGGAALFIAGALGVYLTGKAIVRFRRINQAYNRALQFERWRKRALPAEGGETVQVEPATESRLGVYLRRALVLTLLLLLFLPYTYEPGGRLKIFPSERQVLTSDIGGILEEIHFDGGETLAKGTVVARIATTDLRAQTSVLSARIAEQEALIRDLRARPKPEEVAVAQSMVDLTRQRAQFSTARVPRLEALYADRVIAFEELDAARKEAEVDAREVARAEASLSLSRVGTPPDRIAAEQARLAALIEERAAVEGRIGRTTMAMPFDGTLLTLRLKDRLNSVLERGAPFATVEATQAMQAEIDLPEVDVGYVRVGQPIRVRANAFADRDYAGTVVKIDRDVTAQSFGNVVKVIAEIENPDGDLRTGMTGYAKVEGVTMPVWKAFTLALQRFFQVQVWSWIP